MAPHSCLTEHLITSLNSICGRWNREGDRVPNPGVLQPDWPRLAQAIPPDMLPELFQLGEGPKSRVRDLQRVCDEMPSCTLADEILTPGEGQVRALITVGGNPAVALPDQNRTLRALDDLELGVCVDITMTPTARRADYVLPAKHHLEREDVTEFMDMFFEVPYAFYTQPVVEAGAEVIDDWEVFAGLAARMGDTIELADLPEQLARPPSAAGVPPIRTDAVAAPSVGTGASMKQIVRQATADLERELIRKALDETGGNVTRAASKLGISRKGLQNKMKEFGLREK